MVKVLVRPGHTAFFHGCRWREGEIVDIPDSYCPEKKAPLWAVFAGTAEAKAIAEQIKERAKDRGIKTYAPSAMMPQDRKNVLVDG